MPADGDRRTARCPQGCQHEPSGTG